MQFYTVEMLVTLPSATPHPPTPNPSSHSEGEPPGDAQAAGGMGSPDSALLSQLYTLVARQQQELQQMKEDQERSVILLIPALEQFPVTCMYMYMYMYLGCIFFVFVFVCIYSCLYLHV